MTGSCRDLADPTPRKLDAPPAPVKRIIRKFRKAPRGLAEYCKTACAPVWRPGLEEPSRTLSGKRYPQAERAVLRGKALWRPCFFTAGEKTLASARRPLYTPVSQRTATHAFRFGTLLQRDLGQPRYPEHKSRTAEEASGCIAQLVEQLTLNQPVLGSNPRAPTTSLSFLTSKPRTEPHHRLRSACFFAQD